MAEELTELCEKLKYIKEYLVKLGSSRRTAKIKSDKDIEVEQLKQKFDIILENLTLEGKVLDKLEVECIEKLCDKINNYYLKIKELCLEKPIVSVRTDLKENTTMEKFELKTANALLPIMTGDIDTTKRLISNIEMYDSMIDDGGKKQLIQFVLMSRISESAKLRMRNNYSSVADLISDMRSILLPKKSDTAIQSKLHQARQNNKSIEEYGKELEQLFVDLTITQANGDSSAYQTLKPINERMAIKRFGDGLRNSRLSTIIAARNYSTLKDAIQGALDEMAPNAEEQRVMSFHQNRGRSSRYQRGNFHNNYNRGASRVFSNSQNYNYRGRGNNGGPSGMRNFHNSSFYRGRSGFRGRTTLRHPARQHHVNIADSSNSSNSTRGSQNLQTNTETENHNLFFRA